MMDAKKQISDELLAKYMSGQATPSEEAEVLEYLAENDENLEDFLQMCSAVEANQPAKTQTVSRINRRWIWITSIAATVLIVIACAIFIQNYHQPDNNLVQQQESKETPNEIKESGPNNTKQIQIPDSQQQRNATTNTLNPQHVEPKNYADSSKKINYANMVYPSSKLTSISRDRKSLNFRWNTDAVEIHFSVTDENNETLINKQLPFVKYYTLALPDDKDTLHWQAVFIYADGNTTVKKGTIIRWDLGINVDNNQKDN